MDYKHIRVDMNTCTDPIFESADGKEFTPGNIEDLIELISESLFSELLLYQDLWDTYHVQEFQHKTENTLIDFQAWEKSLAESLSQELPGDYSVYYYDKSLQHSVRVE